MPTSEAPADPRSPADLSGKQRRHLRALAHHLDPVVQVGQHGYSPGIRDELRRALASHELVKVKLGRECPEAATDLSARLDAELGAHVVQTIGRVLVVYRRHPKEPRIELPA